MHDGFAQIDNPLPYLPSPTRTVGEGLGVGVACEIFAIRPPPLSPLPRSDLRVRSIPTTIPANERSLRVESQIQRRT